MIRYLLVLAVALTYMVSYGLVKTPEYLDARRRGAKTEIALKVVDDQGLAVSNAAVHAFLGMNFRPQGHNTSGFTDENGRFTISDTTCGDEIEIGVEKVGYYASIRKLSYATMGKEHGVADGLWQPFGKVEELILRRIRNPVSMVARRFWKFNYTEALDKWIGFDLPKNDFVYPHGTGEVADFEVCIDWNGDWIPRYRGMTVEIRFQDPYSGYYETKKNLESEFKGPYTAEPHRRYLQSAEFSEKVLSDGEIEERH